MSSDGPPSGVVELPTGLKIAPPAPQLAVEAAPNLTQIGIDFMWKSPVSECEFVILDCCFIFGVEGNSVTGGALLLGSF